MRRLFLKAQSKGTFLRIWSYLRVLTNLEDKRALPSEGLQTATSLPTGHRHALSPSSSSWAHARVSLHLLMGRSQPCLAPRDHFSPGDPLKSYVRWCHFSARNPPWLLIAHNKIQPPYGETPRALMILPPSPFSISPPLAHSVGVMPQSFPEHKEDTPRRCAPTVPLPSELFLRSCARPIVFHPSNLCSQQGSPLWFLIWNCMSRDPANLSLVHYHFLLCSISVFMLCVPH